MCEKTCENCGTINTLGCSAHRAEDCGTDMKEWTPQSDMTYQKAVEIINNLPGFFVEERFEEIYVPLAFVLETYTDDIKEAFFFLQCNYGYVLN